METKNYITYAVPVFIAAMLLEALVALARRRPVYGINDTFSNLACGMGSQLMGLFLGVLVAAGYGFVYEHWRLIDLEPGGWVAWTLALVGVDLAYYFWHRLSHTVNFLWATHVVHHQSEEYNLSVALRQTWFGSAFSWPFYLPLAVLGVPVSLFLLSYSINLLYQFIIHTRAVRTLGPLDWVLNTPSHHRVHHGSNVEYLDKNYGGILIVWDRLFGSFRPETTPVEYGLVKPLRSWNPLWANVHYWAELATASGSMRRWRDKLRVWVKNPGWLPGDASAEDAKQRAMGRLYRKFRTESSPCAIVYVALQLVATIAGTVLVMARGFELSATVLIALNVSMIGSMALWEGLLAGRERVPVAEAVRLALTALATAALAPPPEVAGAVFAHLGVSGALLAVLALRSGRRPCTAPSASTRD